MLSMAGQVIAEDTAKVIEAAVHHEARLERDKARDGSRHPEAILNFFEVAPGQRVLDLFSGGGYYSELLARVVGEQGSVLVHNNQAYLPFAKEDLAERHYQERLPNAEVIISEADELQLPAASFDRIFFILGFHDTYYHEPGWPAIDRERLLQQMFVSLKPGGIVAIIDHDAAPESDINTAHELHRLAKRHVVDAMEAAGFKLQGSLAVLENPEDKLTLSAFDEAVRGRTSRYVLKFVKPKL
ncbi:methyltransferase domain-containing protein [Shewanella rhizosphaerae]|uniref:class I SAM-dependent methyltransferase n=1 Tax=Shewanella rhizosphaerae TaxID=2864207 RepID=UPI001C65D67E|nr:methyltransferase domain-containing protein [Shewanella rhizosphaerae]QYK12717.1 methyltransferase domain-containing protein [Shewanella rhizosphaerae]